MNAATVLITGALTGIGRATERTVERFGRLNIAVNNAGTEGQLAPITEQSLDNYAGAFDTNVLQPGERAT